MGLFNKDQNNITIEPAVNITNPLVVPPGSVLLVGDKAYRAETYALVEIPIQPLIEVEA